MKGKRFFIILLACMFFLGCASTLKKTCNNLKDASQEANKFYIRAQSIIAVDPNLVEYNIFSSVLSTSKYHKISYDDLEAIKQLRDIISDVAGATCSLEELSDILE